MNGVTLEELDARVCEGHDRHWREKARWREDREAAMLHDYRHDRGYLLVSPQFAGAAIHARIITHEGREYRILIDRRIKAWTDREGRLCVGFWLPPTKTPEPCRIKLPTEADQ